ncbi:MAG: response regulator [Cyanobacteria bacterium P01_A01_bin.135]
MRYPAILMAEDDEDDRLLFQEALQENQVTNPLYFAEDGEDLMAFLRHQGKYVNRSLSPRPGLILLDLNMPKKDGRQALAEIKSDAELKSIPVVVLTTSREEQDVVRSYSSGVNSFIVKPAHFNNLVEVAAFIGHYWLELVKLPD